MNASAPHVAVVGAGLAGMAAAVALESAGVRVTLLEARRSLGGRAGAYDDPQTGESLDNCQHVLLGCCTNLLDFYERIGASDQVRWERAIRFLDGRGRTFELGATRGLPAPFHLSLAGARFSLLTLRERTQLARAMLAMMRLGRRGRAALADRPFGEWLDAHGQSPELVRKLYEPVLIGSLNMDVREASAAYAIQVFQDALLAHAKGGTLGLPVGTLGDLYRKLPCRDVRLGARVAGLVVEDHRATGVRLQSGEAIAADAVVLATNHHATVRFGEPFGTGDARFARLGELRSVPILGVHLWFDRPVLRASHAALIEPPLQWVFRKDDEGRVLKGVISAATAWVDVPREEAIASFDAQLRATLPGARDAKLLRGSIVIEKRATFAAVPGVDALRPSQSPPDGGVGGLFLAGDYTRTGWPATMEGAVRSGYLAAEGVLESFGRRERFLVPDLPVQWPGRLIGLDDGAAAAARAAT